ncbi:MAG: cobalt-precorrin-5B (C(1))-methyltransferase [Dongiaceae bacterium]
MSRKPEGKLRRGWTTGACATAAAAAAYTALLTGEFPDPVEIVLPKGERPSFALARKELADGGATAGIVKDAGDDPDVTHGALILSTVRLGEPGGGVTFRAGEGIGTVTRPGLALAVGEPAINPAPRRMMAEAIARIAAANGAAGDVEITVAIPGGAEIARHTWNAKLGIVGGLSVLGTTGVVHPYSCSAWIASIHRGIDVARASGLAHVAACTGSTSEAGVRRLYDLPEIGVIDMGDFAGGTLKYLRRHPVKRVTLAGGFAKISKLAAGHLDLHSGRSQVDPEALAGALGALGAPPDLLDRARRAAAAGEILAEARAAGLPLADRIAAEARARAAEVAGAGVAVEVMIFDREGALIGRAPFSRQSSVVSHQSESEN